MTQLILFIYSEISSIANGVAEKYFEARWLLKSVEMRTSLCSTTEMINTNTIWLCIVTHFPALLFFIRYITP